MEPTTFHQAPGKMALAVLGATAFVPVGLWMINDPDGSWRYSPALIRVIGFVTVAFFGGGAALGAVQLVRPARLRLAPEGLTYASLWWRKTWAWCEVGSFAIEDVGSGRMIRFDVASGADRRQAIPADWLVSLDEVCEQLNAARDRWR